jgi:hypothetical protein
MSDRLDGVPLRWAEWQSRQRDAAVCGTASLSAPVAALGASRRSPIIVATVEPMSATQAWVRGQHPARTTANLRTEDSVNIDILMSGTGFRRSQFLRLLMQEAILARAIRLNAGL